MWGVLRYAPHLFEKGFEMAIFAVHVVVPRGYEYEQFAPGDVLPEWAEGLVGAHCLVLDAEPAGVDADEPDTDESDPDAVPGAEPAGVDFTKPAGRGQGRKK